MTRVEGAKAWAPLIVRKMSAGARLRHRLAVFHEEFRTDELSPPPPTCTNLGQPLQAVDSLVDSIDDVCSSMLLSYPKLSPCWL